jgi:large subunit ribosomal protein L10
LKLDRKQTIVEEMHEKFGRSKVVIVTDYKGLNVSAMNDLRNKLREAKIEFKVVKNTLLEKASEDTYVNRIRENFKGPSAVALSYDDPVAPAKVLSDFVKDNKHLEIKIGVIGDKVLDVDDIKALAKLPPREILLGKFLSVLLAVPGGFVRVLAGVPQQFLRVLVAIRDKKQGAEG